MDRQSSTSDNGSYRKIFDPHGDGSSIGPQTNRTLSEMVPWRCLTLALERLLARRPDGILVSPVECDEIGPDLFRAPATRENRVGLCQHQRREVRERKLRSRL